MTRHPLIAIGLGAFILSSTSCASTSPAPDPVRSKDVEMRSLREEIKDLQTRSRMPGLHVSVVDGDRTLFSYIDGIRAVGHKDHVTSEDQWHLGSCTKPMTAFLIGQLVDRKKLSWTTTLEGIVPKNTHLHPTLRFITIEQLLAHHSGLADVTEPDQGRLWPTLFTDQSTALMRDRLVHALLRMPARFEPGRKFEYSNSGYLVLGWIIERLSERQWERVIQDDLFSKLGMSSCGFGSAGREDKKTPRQPWSHDFRDGAQIAVAPGLESDNPPALGPAGTVHCNVQDWQKFLRLILKRDEGTRVVSEATYDKLLKTAGEGPGTFASLGRKDRLWAKGPVFSMTGSNTMNYALMAVSPNLGRIYTLNTNTGHDAAGEAMVEILKRLTELE